MSANSILEVTGLVAGYGSTPAVHNASFSVSEGECAVLIGPNGHGKTTILRAISGLVRPTAGEIRFDGKISTHEKVEKLVDRGLIHIPQGDLVFPDMTVAENLTLGAFSRSAHKRAKEKLERVFEQFPKLAERSGQRARTLSGGERRMLALGRGMMGEARLMMIDEPSLGLAPVIVDEVYELIRGIADSGLTVLLVEENVTRAATLADRVHLVENGEILRSGTADAVLNDAAVAATYLGVTE